MIVLWSVLTYILVFMIGAVVYSYLHLVVDRLPKKGDLLARHTFCPKCEHEQSIKDVFPIFSYIFNKGKCRYCHEKLSKRELFTEFFGGILAVISVFFYGITLAALLIFLVFCDLSVIALIDFDTQEIPPVLNVILLILGFVAIWIQDGVTIKERIIGLFAISVPMLILVILFNGFGGGDVKMMFAAGFLLGWKGVVAAFFVGAILGGVFAIVLLVSKKIGRKEYFAFGPFLSIGIGICYIYNIGANIIQTYIDMIVNIKNLT